MANRLKSSKSKSPDPDKLKPEKEEQVTVKELVKDERTHKIAGTVALLLCCFLFIAFVSYVFTWREDQDKVFKGASILLPSTEVKTSNLLGNIGAYISHQFFYNAFGVASFLFCSFFFVLGVNGLFGRKLFSIWRNLRYLIAGVLYFSVAASFFAGGSDFSWGGALGNMLSDWLVKMLGNVGTFVLLFAGGLAYIIWRFNPTFKVPSMPKRKPSLVPANVDPETGELKVEEKDEEEEVKPVKPNKKNQLKKDNGALVAPPPVVEEEAPLDLQIIEKDPEPEELVLNNTGEEEEEEEHEEEEEAPFEEDEEEIEEEEEEVEEIPAPVISPRSNKPQAPNLELEIKTYSPEPSDEDIPDTVGEDAPPAAVLAPYDPALDLRDYKYPSLDLLEQHGSEKIIQDPAELENNKNQIINTLKNYDIHIQKISATVGPTVTLYEIVPAAGVRISRIKNLEDDIALSLAALGIRIIAPIPGKGTIGIEVPNVKKTVVSMKSLLASEKFQFNNHSLPVAIGKKIDNDNFIVDLATMPHLLMAGATGQGKSVGLNAILVSLLYKKHPSQLKLVLVDPKKVELSLYRTIERHFLAKLPGEEEAIITDTKKVINTLNALCIEMDNRYDLLKEAGTRNIKEYNEKFVKRKLNPQKGHQYLPFIVLVVDEFADLIMTAGKEVEMPIARLAQLARAVGIHLIIATQRPSVNIITGTIKANFPARIAFKVSSKIDSRTILDTGGAEQLIGKGDMLISYNGELTRLQCAFVDTPEVDSVCENIGNQNGYPQAFLLPEYVDEKDMEGKDFDLNDRDSLFEDAARLIVQNQIGSTSLLQRRMKLGYNRAGRLMDQLEAAGVVGPSQGSKARDVLIKTEMDLEQHLANFL
ncbi:FtsK/SpoIIIE family DNA translocase [Pseudobacter ginsenosidimutans]|uniref:S-DNA-T family DNA segregation ATPase FtsK/SpoIIIE n=1 Tax=Pseudobacter ginsenosidimutans TaxID=661488 RepID=A0A4Q7MKF5_9BACT|nr:DNA translocase FtsK [Pseudobacter ginsenosidimutans]QEC45522.1 DNA translocase FtsK [Pseudobacter ginsenosidimutans]RZS67059.1 S-DNA-T family DNA segregation ATPase FtsK/SpoIIIE [Pseudobacter ginsenosidimutans]